MRVMHKTEHQAITPALVVILALMITPSIISAGSFIEIGAGYNVPLGAWRNVYGAGMAYGGMIGFTFGEFANPSIGGFLLFPAIGSVIQNEYEHTHQTEFVSLYAMTGMVSLSNRLFFTLSDGNILTFDVGYGIFSQRDYATVVSTNYESIDNLSGHGAICGFGLQHAIEFSVFDFVHPFLKCYYSPNKVICHVVGPGGSSINDYEAAESRIGIIAGITLIIVGEE